MRNFKQDDSGSIAVLFTLALLPLLGGAGVALDYSRASSARSSMQNAIDAAVLGAILKDKEERIATAKEIFKANLPPSMSDASAIFNNIDESTLTGTGSYTVRTQWSRVVGAGDLMPTTVKATAKFDAGTSPPGTGSGKTGDVCVLVLDPTGSQALLVNSGAKVNAPTSEVHVKSKASPAAIFNAGSDLKAKRFCIEGSDVIQNSTNVKNLELKCKTANDPFASGLPAPPSTSCTVNNQNYSGSVTLSPGVYCGWFNFNSPSNVTFQPGVYVIKNGGWNVNGGSFKGDGVTFYFADMSKIQFNSAMDTDITAPTSGTYKGILFYENMSNGKSDFIFNNAVRNRMEGLIHLPSRNVTFNADSKMANDKATIVVHRLIWNNVQLNLSPNKDRPITIDDDSGKGKVKDSSPAASSSVPRLVY